MKSFLKRLIPSSVAHKLRIWRLQRLIRSYRAKTVTHRYGAGELTVSIKDPLAEGWYDHDWDELREIGFLRKRKLKPGALVFDLGAHQGVVAMMLAREIGPTGKVIAVEATAHNASVALENAKQNGFSEIVTVIHALVAGEPNKQLSFSCTLNGSVNNKGIGDQIRTVSVDSLAQQYGHPDVVFIDIEGFEGHALEGAREVLLKGADFSVEVHAGAGLELHTTKEAILDFFTAAKYCCFIAPEVDGNFTPWQVGMTLPTNRFYLIATPPQTPRTEN